MRVFFNGWRRKAGVVTLAMACVFMAEWVRSQFTSDAATFGVRKVYRTIISLDGHIHWWAWHTNKGRCFAKVGMDASQIRDWMTMERAMSNEIRIISEKMPNHPQRGEYFDEQALPYWSLVLPLTVASAYLLLSKPRPATRKQTTEPSPTTGE